MRSTKESPALRIRVLVVDDSEDIRTLYSTYFKWVGADVLIAVDGLQALDAIRMYRPDAVLLDLAMPGMTGWELLEKLRSDPRTQRTAVLALTGHVFPGSKEFALRAGADVYLTKPCVPQVAWAFILQVLRGDDPADRGGFFSAV
jgi:CheY-like chemotaxis protein